MANLKFLLVLSIIVAVGTSEISMPPEPPSLYTNATTTSTTTKPSTTTTKPSTTITPSSTVKPPPNTTTTSTTTAKPTTTTRSTTVTPITTAKPNTTTTSTTAAPITTPKPTPIPGPQTGNWSVNFTGSNHSCMIVDAAIQFEIILDANSTKKINLPGNATSLGSCKNLTDNIDLTWGNNSLNMEFVKNGSTFELQSINATLTVDGKNYSWVHKTPEFGTPVGNSYKCLKVQTLNLTEQNSNKTVAYLHLSQVQLQAFANATGHKFDSAIDCEASPITSDVVPIVVGCVLAALVVMIMVAYLIARRRCQARGYLSINDQPDD